MGLAALGALIMLLMALAAQSPVFLKRLRNGGRPLSRRARSFTGFALAFLLLAFGFFLAGVPLEGQPIATSDDTEPTAAEAEGNSASSMTEAVGSVPSATPRQTPATGAFTGPPRDTEAPTAAATDQSGDLLEDVTGSPTPTVASTEVQSQSSPTATAPLSVTQTATPLPTLSPTPTVTPTPIVGETAQLDTAGSTIWLRRTPGGENIMLLSDGDTVILEDGHANYAGVLWRQVSSVSGISGWILEEFLQIAEEET